MTLNTADGIHYMTHFFRSDVASCSNLAHSSHEPVRKNPPIQSLIGYITQERVPSNLTILIACTEQPLIKTKRLCLSVPSPKSALAVCTNLLLRQGPKFHSLKWQPLLRDSICSRCYGRPNYPIASTMDQLRTQQSIQWVSLHDHSVMTILLLYLWYVRTYCIGMETSSIMRNSISLPDQGHHCAMSEEGRTKGLKGLWTTSRLTIHIFEHVQNHKCTLTAVKRQLAVKLLAYVATSDSVKVVSVGMLASADS